MDWEGWLWPNHFGDPVAEHRAVRTGVGIWDESPLRKWDFRGRDALQAADRIFTNDMSGLALGQIRSEEHTSELQSLAYLVCRLLLEKKKKRSVHTAIS